MSIYGKIFVIWFLSTCFYMIYKTVSWNVDKHNSYEFCINEMVKPQAYCKNFVLERHPKPSFDFYIFKIG